MLSKPVPRWILIGGFLLTGIAGSVNAIGFLGIHHQALAHMSGTSSIISTSLATGQFAIARHASFVLLYFFFGCVISGMITRDSRLRLGRRYGVALAVESALLFAATAWLHEGSNYGDYLAAMACGLQNAMTTTFSGTIIRTTHVTGIVTDLGIAAGLRLRRETVDTRRVVLHLVLLTGFITGGVIGGWGYLRWGFDALLAPAVFTGLVGVGYVVYKHYWMRATPAM